MISYSPVQPGQNKSSFHLRLPPDTADNLVVALSIIMNNQCAVSVSDAHTYDEVVCFMRLQDILFSERLKCQYSRGLNSSKIAVQTWMVDASPLAVVWRTDSGVQKCSEKYSGLGPDARPQISAFYRRLHACYRNKKPQSIEKISFFLLAILLVVQWANITSRWEVTQDVCKNKNHDVQTVNLSNSLLENEVLKITCDQMVH